MQMMKSVAQEVADKKIRVNSGRRGAGCGRASTVQLRCEDAGRYRWFADSPLEGDGFELLVPRHESSRFPTHSGRSLSP